MLRPRWSELEAAVKRDPGNPKLHVALGLAYWDRNDYPRALSGLPARREGWTVVGRGAQLAGRRARGEGRSAWRDRRA